MLRPQDSASRERKLLNGLWRFAVDPGGDGRAARWFAGPLPGRREMAVPASYNDIVADPAVKHHIGEVWYQTTVRVPAGWDGERIVLHLESATHRATVWVGDTEVAGHEGGYTPFEADVTTLVRAGETVRITVVVDNRLSFRSIPPGVVEDTPAGPRQRYWHDFFNYAGLHRNVWLHRTPADRITDVAVVSRVEDGCGLVDYRIEAEHAAAARIQAVLRNADGVVVALALGAAGTLTVPGVRLWGPGDAYLYDLEVQLVAESGERLDSYHQSVGVRTVTVAGNRFLVNGDPVYLRGFGKHEDIPVIGKGHNDAYLVHDSALLDWIGANSFRTSHYPYAEDVLDYADRHGVLVIDEVAAVGLNLELGPGVFGAAGYSTWDGDTIDEGTRAVHAQAIRELIARDRNHPSVVLWSIANEPETTSAGAEAYFRPLFELARALDPTRPVSFANVAGATLGLCRVAPFADVLLLNRYYGWYVHPGDLAAAELAWEQELCDWATAGKPIIVTEYGADTYPGEHSLTAEPWTEEYQAEFLRMNHRVFDRIDAVVGEHVWNFADFATMPGIQRVGGNRKGIFTRDRHPKSAAHLLRQRWRKD